MFPIWQKNHFHRRGTALQGKSSPALWGRSGVEPPFTGMTKIFLAISQSCPTISRRATHYHYLYLYRVIVSAHKHFGENGKPDLPLFVSSETPTWGWSEEVPTFPITGNGIQLNHVSLCKEEEEGRERLPEGWGRCSFVLTYKSFQAMHDTLQPQSMLLRQGRVRVKRGHAQPLSGANGFHKCEEMSLGKASYWKHLWLWWLPLRPIPACLACAVGVTLLSLLSLALCLGTRIWPHGIQRCYWETLKPGTFQYW